MHRVCTVSQYNKKIIPLNWGEKTVSPDLTKKPELLETGLKPQSGHSSG